MKFKCPNCGATIVSAASDDYKTCVWCGTNVEMEKITNSENPATTKDRAVKKVVTHSKKLKDAETGSSLGEHSSAKNASFPSENTSTTIPTPAFRKVHQGMIQAGGAIIFGGANILGFEVVALIFPSSGMAILAVFPYVFGGVIVLCTIIHFFVLRKQELDIQSHVSLLLSELIYGFVIYVFSFHLLFKLLLSDSWLIVFSLMQTLFGLLLMFLAVP